jgi:hypothetical protein
MGLKITAGAHRFERGVGFGGCLILLIPLAIAGKGIVFWYVYDWWHIGLLEIVLGALAFIKLLRVFATWNVRFIELQAGVVRLGQVQKGRELVDCQFSWNDFASAGVLKKSTHGAAYGLGAFLRTPPPPGSELQKHGRIGDGYDLLWWTQEYPGTIRKLLTVFQQRGVRDAGELELQSLD